MRSHLFSAHILVKSPELGQGEGLNFFDEFDILLVIRLSSGAPAISRGRFGKLGNVNERPYLRQGVQELWPNKKESHDVI